MIINQYNFLDPVFNGVTHAWPLNEGNDKMRREVFMSGADFFPQGVTTVSGKTKFSGGLNSYMTAPDIGLSVDTDEAFTWCFTIRPTSLPAGTFDVLCKGETVFGANAEYRVYLSTNTLNFRIYYGASSNRTVSATITAGVDNIVFLVHDPVNDIISIKVNAAAPVTLAHADGCRAKYGSLMMGNTAGQPFLTNITPPYASPTLPGINTTSINSAISNVLFWKGTALTATEQATVRTILLTTGFPYPTLAEVDYTLDPDTLDDAAKIQRYDFTDLSTQYQDVNKLLPVVNNNDPIRVIESLWGTNEEAIAPSDAVRPLCKTATLNGLPTAYTNGVDTQMNLNNPLQTVEADFALFIVAKNDANSDVSKKGTHWMSHVTNGAMYIAQVGYNNPGYARGYLAGHKSDGVPPYGPVNSSGTIYPDNFNTLEIQSVDQVWNAIASGYVPLSGSRDVPNVNPVDYDLFFKTATSKTGPDVANWWAWGNIAEMFFIQATLTPCQRARIRKFLDLKYNTVSAYMGY